VLYLEPFSFFICGMRRGCRWADSASQPPPRLLRMDPGEDERVRTASPQRIFGAVFPDRVRRQLCSSPRSGVWGHSEDLPRNPGFQHGVAAAAGAPLRSTKRATHRNPLLLVLVVPSIKRMTTFKVALQRFNL
jgi:hypothetical protein